MHGFLSLMQLNSNPLAWIGPRGITIFNPGTCVKNDSGLCEWYKAPWPTAPEGVLIVSDPQLK